MKLTNTTSVSDNEIAFAYAFSAVAGIEIDEIVLKNKTSGKISGQWGWYFPVEKKIVLIIPQNIKPYFVIRKRDGIEYWINNKMEFVVSVLAHELRHAYQWQIAGTWKETVQWTEMDARRYEYLQLLRYRSLMVEKERKAANHS